MAKSIPISKQRTNGFCPDYQKIGFVDVDLQYIENMETDTEWKKYAYFMTCYILNVKFISIKWAAKISKKF